MQRRTLARFISRYGQRIATYIVLAAGVLLIVFPFLWSFSAALKANDQIFVIPMQWFPREAQWQNYVLPFQEKPFFRYFANSLFAAGASVVLTLVIASLAGY